MKIAFILAGFFLLLLLLEALFPLRRRTWALVRRLIVNLCVSALAFTAAAWIVRPIGLSLAAWMSATSFGLLHIVPMPAVVQFGLAFLLMDLTFYYWHLVNHMLPVLWRFHNVHHIDPDLDVSTALRFHVGEVVLSAGFRVLQVSLIGLPPLTYMIYEGVFQASTLFQHSNIRLPLQVERLLNTVLVTPACTVSIILSSQGRPTRTTRSFSPGGTGSTGACDSMFHNPPSSLASRPIRSQRTTHCGTSSSYPSAGNGITGVGPMATSQCATPPRPACRGPVCWSKMAKIVSFTGCQPFRNGEKGFDHGVGHPLLLLCGAKVSNYRKNKEFNDLGHYSEWPKVADAVIKAERRIPWLDTARPQWYNPPAVYSRSFWRGW